jgi:RNA polymerase-binding transcription factor DksA
MNTITAKRCEEKLLRRRHEILPVLKHLAGENGDEADERRFDFVNPQYESTETFLVDRLAAMYGRELENIETTLSRIRMGTFGYCRACHQPIEPARLQRFPQVEFCSHCKESRESIDNAK